LSRLDATLHGELTAAKYLWNSKKGDSWPKDEQDLSDYVAKHLREDLGSRGIIVNREVQIRRGPVGHSGQATDIHVDTAVRRETQDICEAVSAIIEVKGNWHRDLRTAMRTQLRDRYLKENLCRDGIYLVGWFSCTNWGGEDDRRKRCPNMSLDDARDSFRKQAEELSVDGYHLKSYVLDVSLN
jgi:hypothetical protein